VCAALKAMIVANEFLESEVELLQAVSQAYVRGTRSNCCSVDTNFSISTDFPVVLIRRSAPLSAFALTADNAALASNVRNVPTATSVEINGH